MEQFDEVRGGLVIQRVLVETPGVRNEKCISSQQTNDKVIRWGQTTSNKSAPPQKKKSGFCFLRFLFFYFCLYFFLI